MEILKKTKKAFPLIAVLSLLLIAAIISGNSHAVFPAFADNQTAVGGGSLRIDIAPMASNESSDPVPSFYSGGIWGTDADTGESSVLNGAVLSVKVPANVDAFVAYDLDTAGEIWAIRGEDEINGVPYLKLDHSSKALQTNRDYDQVVGNSTVGEYYPMSWRYAGESADHTQRQYIFRLGAAGTLSVRVTDGTNVNEQDYVVANIDWTGAQPVYNEAVGGYMMGLQTGTANGMPTYAVRIDFTDAFPNTAPYSAASGIKEIYVLRFDDSLTDSAEDEVPDFTTEELEDLVKEHTAYRTGFNSAVRDATVRFDLQNDGWYYYYTIDGVGNISIGPLLDNKLEISGDPDYIIKAEVGGGTIVDYNVKSNIETAEALIREHAPGTENAVTEKLYDDVNEALAQLTFAFRTLGDTEEALLKKGELYFEFFNGVYATLLSAVESGEEFVSFEVINDYFVNGEFSVGEVEGAVQGKPGDEVMVRISLGGIDRGMDGYNEIRSAAGNNGKIIRIDYILYLNGEPMTSDAVAGSFILDYKHESGVDCVFVKQSDGIYVKANIPGANFDRIMLGGASGTIYLVIDGEDNAIPYWVWIIVGIAAALMIAAVVTLIVLKRKGIIGKKAKRNPEKPKTVTDTVKKQSQKSAVNNKSGNVETDENGRADRLPQKGDYDD